MVHVSQTCTIDVPSISPISQSFILEGYRLVEFAWYMYGTSMVHVSPTCTITQPLYLLAFQPIMVHGDIFFHFIVSKIAFYFLSSSENPILLPQRFGLLAFYILHHPSYIIHLIATCVLHLTSSFRHQTSKNGSRDCNATLCLQRTVPDYL